MSLLHLSWRYFCSLVPAEAHLGGSPAPISIPEYPDHGIWEASFLGNHLGQRLNCTDRRNEPPERKPKSKAFAEPQLPRKSPGEEKESTSSELCGRPSAEKQRKGEIDVRRTGWGDRRWLSSARRLDSNLSTWGVSEYSSGDIDFHSSSLPWPCLGPKGLRWDLHSRNSPDGDLKRWGI